MTRLIDKTILIADDDWDLVHLVSMRCRRLGLKVFVAHDAFTALSLIRSKSPSLVCLDVSMPCGSGLSVCEMLTADERYCKIPIVIITGKRDPETIARCHKLCAYYIPKCPDIWGRLYPLLCDLLDLPQSTAATAVAGESAAFGTAGEGEGHLGVANDAGLIAEVPVSCEVITSPDFPLPQECESPSPPRAHVPRPLGKHSGIYLELGTSANQATAAPTRPPADSPPALPAESPAAVPAQFSAPLLPARPAAAPLAAAPAAPPEKRQEQPTISSFPTATAEESIELPVDDDRTTRESVEEPEYAKEFAARKASAAALELTFDDAWLPRQDVVALQYADRAGNQSQPEPQAREQTEPETQSESQSRPETKSQDAEWEAHPAEIIDFVERTDCEPVAAVPSPGAVPPEPTKDHESRVAALDKIWTLFSNGPNKKRAEAGSASSAPSSKKGKPQEEKTILIADDDGDLVQMLVLRCTQLGLRVFRSPDAMHALLGVHRIRPDLAILDVNMPGGNGLSVCEMLAGDPAFAKIPVIIMTGETNADISRRCQSIGAKYLAKGAGLWDRLEPLIRTALDLPGAPALADAPGSPLTEPPAAPRRPKVLCIDDDPDISKILKLRLEARGVDVLRAFNGMQGYWTALDMRPDLIVLDMVMPDGTGNYIFGRLRAHPLTEKTPVLILTGVNTTGMRRQMFGLGVDGYLTKPLDFSALVEHIRQYIPLSEPENTPATVGAHASGSNRELAGLAKS